MKNPELQLKKRMLVVVALLLVCLFWPTSKAADGPNLDIRAGQFKLNGNVYVVERVVAHQPGAAKVEIVSDEHGGWYEIKPEPEFGRRLHRQVK